MRKDEQDRTRDWGDAKAPTDPLLRPQALTSTKKTEGRGSYHPGQIAR